MSPALVLHNNLFSLGFIYSKKSGVLATVRGIKLVFTLVLWGFSVVNMGVMWEIVGDLNPVKRLSPIASSP